MPLDVREVTDEPEPEEAIPDTVLADAIAEAVPWEIFAKERRASLKAIYEFTNGFHPALISRRPADGSQSGR